MMAKDLARALDPALTAVDCGIVCDPWQERIQSLGRGEADNGRVPAVAGPGLSSAAKTESKSASGAEAREVGGLAVAPPSGSTGFCARYGAAGLQKPPIPSRDTYPHFRRSGNYAIRYRPAFDCYDWQGLLGLSMGLPRPLLNQGRRRCPP